MKKVLLSVAVLCSVALVSCNKANKEAVDSDSVVAPVEDTQVVPADTDTAAAPAVQVAEEPAK